MSCRALVVRDGVDGRLPKQRDKETGELVPVPHVLLNVYPEMLLQICRDYSGLPDPRSLSMTEIRFFYDGLRAELRAATSPKG